MTDPRFRHATCRQPDVDATWWDGDANIEQRVAAADLCAGCPARAACDELRRQLGAAAVGTYAGHYLPWTDHADPEDPHAAFASVFGSAFDHHLTRTLETHGQLTFEEAFGWAAAPNSEQTTA